MSTPLAYFISFRTYGTWLHGDARGSVDRNHNRFAAARVPASPTLEAHERRIMREPPVVLDVAARAFVERTIREVTTHRKWVLHAVNPRSNHVHLVVRADRPPERVMNDLKSWTTRRLVEAGLRPPGTPTWSRHGSTRWLFTPNGFYRACAYVTNGQEGQDGQDGQDGRGGGGRDATPAP